MDTGNSFVHRALRCGDDAEYLAGVLPFARSGGPVLVAVPTRELALLAEDLGPGVTTLDMTRAGRNPGRVIAGVLLAFVDAHPGVPVRIVSQVTWPRRSAAEHDACVVHEALVNVALAGRPVTMLCPHGPAVAADMALTHHGERFAPEAAIAAHQARPAPPDNAETYVIDTPNMAGLRRIAAKFAARHQLDEPRSENMALALTELASNSIEHAHDSATVVLGTSGDRLVCQVHDSGHITDPLAGRRPAAPEQLRGRGLLLVHELADLVRVHSGTDGTTVEVQFALRSTGD